MRGIKDIRLSKYDYKSDGYYFVTVIAYKKIDYFFTREKDVEVELKDLVGKVSGLELDFFVVMSNHVHIIFVLRNSSLLLGEIVRRFKAKVSHKFKQFTWQPNYFEHVIRNEKALSKIREYILKNPNEELEELKQFYK